MVLGCILGMAGSLVFAGTAIEVIKLGDMFEHAKLREVAKFVSLEQYDSVLL